MTGWAPWVARGPAVGCPYGAVAIAIAYGLGWAEIACSAVLVAISMGVTVPGRSLVTYAVAPLGVMAIWLGPPTVTGLSAVLVAVRIGVTASRPVQT